MVPVLSRGERAAVEAAALTRPCPTCGAAPGARCLRVISRDPRGGYVEHRRGEAPERAHPHYSRQLP